MWKDPRSFWDDLTLNLNHIHKAKKCLPPNCLYRLVPLYPGDLIIQLWEHPEWKEELLKKEAFCSFCRIRHSCPIFQKSKHAKSSPEIDHSFKTIKLIPELPYPFDFLNH